MLDAETKIILESFQTSSKVSSDNLAHISSTYRQTLANDLIHLIDKKLVSYEQTLTSTKCLCRIVVSSSLRRDIFFSPPCLNNSRVYGGIQDPLSD